MQQEPSPDQSLMADRLRQDAQRIPLPPFDATLHQAMLARLPPRARSTWVRRVGPWMLAAAASVVITLNLAPTPVTPTSVTPKSASPKPASPKPAASKPASPKPAASVVVLQSELPPGSVFAYSLLLAQGEEVLLTALDHPVRRRAPVSIPFNPYEDLL
jgi:hypothetical protein